MNLQSTSIEPRASHAHRALTAAALVCLSPLAIAQVASGATAPFAFGGWSLGLAAQHAQTESSNSDGRSGSEATVHFGVQGDYRWSLNPRWSLAVGGSFVAGDFSAGNAAGNTTAGRQAFYRDRYSLDLSPGYQWRPDTLVFGKLSAVGAKASAGDGSGDATAQGWGWGVGLRTMLDRNFYWQAELQSVRFNDLLLTTGNTLGLRDTSLGLGVGYRY